MKKKILCIEDDLTIQALVEHSLNEFEVLSALNLAQAEILLKKHEFNALLVDIQLPDGDGLRFLGQILESQNVQHIPILILSHQSEISKKVMAFSLGAEDFISKPFDPIELKVRVTAKINRYEKNREEKQTKTIGNLLLDFSRQKAFNIQNNHEEDLNLTGIEFKILSMLTRRLDQIYSREQIMNFVWHETFIADRTIDSHVAHLRKKIHPLKLKIKTEKNLGYSASVE